MIIAFLLCILSSSVYILAEHQQPPVFVHTKRIEAPTGIKLALPNPKPRQIEVAYTPQRVITVKNNATPLSLSRNTYSTGMQHLKCILKTETPQKKADRTTLELLVCKEPLHNTIAKLLDKETLAKSRQGVGQPIQ